ncbi:hypothetical protein [Bradyrhizobium sp. TM233]|uniref:hypothetical protein n=1 Tax=Bradyrhizobium sp. TM233 TaxID=2599801 RepID=UPI0027D4C38A|nr:hypothetical protein TM233_18130 [Bradyrhizobium sp. TM233]
MADNDNAGSAAAQKAEEKKRFRSEIEFPYADLESALEVAQTIHDKAGSSCETEELAAWMGQSASGGTFRTRLGAARMFGLIDRGEGRATLTQLGRDALTNSGKERFARVTAFLNVELFAAMYEQFKGHALPPPPAIERQVEQFGVSPKQKERARQTFMKSAQYAGFIDASSGRFVKPGIAARDEAANEKPAEEKKRDNGSGGDEPPGFHPFVQGLLKELPPAGNVWPEEQRKLWLDTASSIFKMIYKDAKPAQLPPPPGDAEYRKSHGLPPREDYTK